jgi:ribonuclease HIII
MHDSFEIISLNGKIAVYYYKNGMLAVEGDDKNSFFRSTVHQVNKLFQRENTCDPRRLSC